MENKKKMRKFQWNDSVKSISPLVASFTSSGYDFPSMRCSDPRASLKPKKPLNYIKSAFLFFRTEVRFFYELLTTKIRKTKKYSVSSIVYWTFILISNFSWMTKKNKSSSPFLFHLKERNYSRFRQFSERVLSKQQYLPAKAIFV